MMKQEPVTLTVDGIPISVPQGTTVLEAALGAGIYIPHLCHHPDLEPAGVCRLCMIEIEGRGMTLACRAPVEPGLAVRTESDTIQQVRRIALELLIVNHQGDCLSCAETGDCALQRVAGHVGIEAERLARLRRPTDTVPIDASNPFFARDPGKCVLCGICVRTCHQLQGIGAIDFAFRGYQTVVSTFAGRPIAESHCESCGECVVRCPVGALALKDFQRPTREVRTICPYCGTGCEMFLGVRGNKIVSVRGDRDHTLNRGSLCVKGRFGHGFVHHPDRLTAPLIRDAAGNSRFPGFREASWEEALDLVAQRLAAVRQVHGPAAVMGIASARGTNEETYLFQKFMRAVVGTNNVDNCARVCHSPSVTGLAAVFGSGAATNSLEEIDETDLLLLVGCNPAEAHPVIGMRIRRAVSERGVRLIVADPRRIALAELAEAWLPLRPGTNVALLNGLAHVILRDRLHDADFIAARGEGFEAFAAKLAEYPPERVAAITGVAPHELERAARLYGQAERAMILYGLGVTEHSDGSHGVMGCAHLALLTGNVGRRGTGVNPLRGQNNVQGACDMGALPNVLPGYQNHGDEAVRAKFEAAWQCRLPTDRGWKYTEAWPLARRGRIRAAYLVGHNPAQTDPHTQRVVEALEAMDFVVVQDLFFTKTAQAADVVLPAASFAEKEGTFVNADRRVQRLRKAVEPPPGCRTDLEIFQALSARMGYPMPAHGAAEVMDEIAAMVPIMRGISYRRLDQEPLVWPCLDDKDQGARRLYEKEFPRGRATFQCIDYSPPAEESSDAYPLILTTGRRLEHYNCGSMSRRTAGLQALCPEEYLEIHPDDAEAHGIREGQEVEVASQRGRLQVPAHLTERCSPGVVFLSFHFEEIPTNELIGDHLDTMACTPAYKVTAVRVTPFPTPAPGNGSQ